MSPLQSRLVASWRPWHYTDIKGTPITHLWRITDVSPFALSYLGLCGEGGECPVTSGTDGRSRSRPSIPPPTVQVYGWRGDVWRRRRHTSYPRRWEWSSLSGCLHFWLHRSQFRNGLSGNSVWLQMCRSSAWHVTAAAAHLFARWLTNTAVGGKPKSKPKPRFFLQNRTETDRKRKIQNRNNTIQPYWSSPSTVVFHTAAARPVIPSVNSRPSLISGRSLYVLVHSARWHSVCTISLCVL